MATNATHAHHSASHGPTKSRSSAKEHADHEHRPYAQLLIMMGIHLPVMFAVMYTMIDNFQDFFINLNQIYMAGMMVAPMAILMLISMKSMYRDTRKNLLTYLSSAAVFAGLLLFMREQTFISDKQFLRSMIPHHSGAVLMCNEAQISDPEIKSLCAKIVEGQKAEIQQMKNILSRLE